MPRVEIFQGRARRRRSDEDKRRLVDETWAPGATVHGVARRHGLTTSQLFTWRKRFRAEVGRPMAPSAVPGFAALKVYLFPPSATQNRFVIVPRCVYISIGPVSFILVAAS